MTFNDPIHSGAFVCDIHCTNTKDLEQDGRPVYNACPRCREKPVITRKVSEKSLPSYSMSYETPRSPGQSVKTIREAHRDKSIKGNVPTIIRL